MTNKSDRYHAFRCLTSDGKFECAYCGCDVWSELEIDHVNGNGKQHREECGLGRYYTIYDWINEGYRITSGETQHPIVTDYIVKNGVAYTRSRWVRTEYILQILCKPCNIRKGVMRDADYRMRYPERIGKPVSLWCMPYTAHVSTWLDAILQTVVDCTGFTTKQAASKKCLQRHITDGNLTQVAIDKLLNMRHLIQTKQGVKLTKYGLRQADIVFDRYKTAYKFPLQS